MRLHWQRKPSDASILCMSEMRFWGKCWLQCKSEYCHSKHWQDHRAGYEQWVRTRSCHKMMEDPHCFSGDSASVNRESMSQSGSYSASDTLGKVQTIHIQSVYSVTLVHVCCCNPYGAGGLRVTEIAKEENRSRCNPYGAGGLREHRDFWRIQPMLLQPIWSRWTASSALFPAPVSVMSCNPYGAGGLRDGAPPLI